MTDEEKDELEVLEAKCLKKDGEPRKDADTEDLERLKELCELDVLPLDEDEKVELARLEAKANKGRALDQPTPGEMLTLSELRKRNQG